MVKNLNSEQEMNRSVGVSDSEDSELFLSTRSGLIGGFLDYGTAATAYSAAKVGMWVRLPRH